MATLKGVATREEAERLNGIELYVAREKLPATDEDEYYHADLIGLAAVSDGGSSRSAASSRSTISAPATSSRSRRRRARPCCCRSPMRWCRRSILASGRVVIELPEEIEGEITPRRPGEGRT